MSASSAEILGVNGSAAPSRLFVINLAASTSPMALSHPSSPELKRYTFFVSRQREDGRERFRLHMGYFATQEEAETLLDSVRDIYPAAWAGPAPTTGMGRRGRIAPGSVVAAAPAPLSAVAKPATAAPVAPAAAVAPAATAAPAAPVAPVQAEAPVAAAKPADSNPPRPASAAPVSAPAPVPAPKAAPVARPVAKPAEPEPLDVMSNLRDVLAQLSEEHSDAPTVQMRIPPELTAVTPPRVAPVAKPAAPELSGADALTLLETPPVAPRQPAAPAVALDNPFAGLENEPEVRLVTPEDTQTLTDIKIDRQNNAPPCFAVQLVWSVSPIDVTSLPHLAIFDAYTLYNVEGNRQGRKWYGLRLGFFSDPNSATQVANYVRSDYKSVAVVPVAVKERDRAKGPERAPAASEPRKASESDLVRDKMDGFELLADDRPAPAKRDLDDAGRKPAPAAAANGAAPAGLPKATGKPAGKRVVARRRPPPVPQGRTVSTGVGGPEVLESTLEILGASTLSLDDGGRAIITDAAARKPVEKKSSGGSRFSRLLSRLSGG